LKQSGNNFPHIKIIFLFYAEKISEDNPGIMTLYLYRQLRTLALRGGVKSEKEGIKPVTTKIYRLKRRELFF